ncbi:nuclear transport factor 2 family protein [Emticicia sp. 17c]|uniref:nuclear transport factor 2 family protein n=1 Tax=Emticicia sp. 17c TaxID=3127704 RepID=UPI00301E3DE1
MLLKSLTLTICYLLITCSNKEQPPALTPDAYTIATPNYAVLAEKAFSYQADFNWDAWTELLADDIQYYLPDSTRPLVGKQAVLAYWKTYPQRMKLNSWQLSRFNHIPILSNHPLQLSGLQGVHVFSMFRSEFSFLDGNSSTMTLNYCSHFNKKNLIDRCYSFHQPLLISPSVTSY